MSRASEVSSRRLPASPSHRRGLRGPSPGLSGRPLSPGLRLRLACLLLPALFLGAFSAGCETRDRSNPFDPGNPDTQGEPELLTAVAGDSQVKLAWNLESFEDIEAIRLLRTVQSGPEESILEQAGAGDGGFLDGLVENRITYIYRLEVQGPGQAPLFTTPAAAGPGPSEPWVGDAEGGGAARLSPDGRHVLYRTGAFRDLLDMDFVFDGSFWAADYFNGAVLYYDAEGDLLREWDHYGANTLALDRKSGLLWVGSFLGRTLTLFDHTGGIVWADSTLGLIEQVEAARGAGVWVASRSTGVSRVVNGAVTDRFPSYSWPVAVCPTYDGAVWIVDRGEPAVHFLTPVGPDSMQSRRVLAVLVDPRDGVVDDAGGLWVADPGRGGVIYIGPDLKEQFLVEAGDVNRLAWDGPGARLWTASGGEGRVRILEVASRDALPGREGRVRLKEAGWTVTVDLHLGGRPAYVGALWR